MREVEYSKGGHWVRPGRGRESLAVPGSDWKAETWSRWQGRERKTVREQVRNRVEQSRGALWHFHFYCEQNGGEEVLLLKTHLSVLDTKGKVIQK